VLAEQETLRRQLAVRVDHQPARDPEIGGKHPGRGEPDLRREPAGADGVTQPVGELAVQRFLPGPVEFDKQLRSGSGTRNRHVSGAYLEASNRLA
jgi:hypothetical protein